MKITSIIRFPFLSRLLQIKEYQMSLEIEKIRLLTLILAEVTHGNTKPRTKSKPKK